MASFASATFDELSNDHEYAVWSKQGIAVIKKIPGGDKNVIQKIAVDLPRMTMPIKGTAAQITALYGKVGDSGTLIFSYETCTARLERMEPPQSIGIGNDLYASALSFIRTASITSVSTDTRITEAGVVRVTEASDTRIVE